jgi:hypothetical protein
VGAQFSADRSIRIAAAILSVRSATVSDSYTRTEHKFTPTPGAFGRWDIRENMDSPTQGYIVKASVLKAIMALGLVLARGMTITIMPSQRKQVCSCRGRGFPRLRRRFAVSCGRARKYTRLSSGAPQESQHGWRGLFERHWFFPVQGRASGLIAPKTSQEMNCVVEGNVLDNPGRMGSVFLQPQENSGFQRSESLAAFGRVVFSHSRLEIALPVGKL